MIFKKKNKLTKASNSSLPYFPAGVFDEVRGPAHDLHPLPQHGPGDRLDLVHQPRPLLPVSLQFLRRLLRVAVTRVQQSEARDRNRGVQHELVPLYGDRYVCMERRETLTPDVRHLLPKLGHLPIRDRVPV